MSDLKAFKEKGELIQAAARQLPQNNFSAVDRRIPLDVLQQTYSLQRWLENHLIGALGDEEGHRVNAIKSSIDDCETALLGIRGVIGLSAEREYSDAEIAGIARRSFGVVRTYAMDRGLAERRDVTDIDQRLTSEQLETRSPAIVRKVIVPERLELVEEPVSYVRAISDPEIDFSYKEMPCPAFMGRANGVRR